MSGPWPAVRGAKKSSTAKIQLKRIPQNKAPNPIGIATNQRNAKQKHVQNSATANGTQAKISHVRARIALRTREKCGVRNEFSRRVTYTITCLYQCC